MPPRDKIPPMPATAKMSRFGQPMPLSAKRKLYNHLGIANKLQKPAVSKQNSKKGSYELLSLLKDECKELGLDPRSHRMTNLSERTERKAAATAPSTTQSPEDTQRKGASTPVPVASHIARQKKSVYCLEFAREEASAVASRSNDLKRLLRDECKELQRFVPSLSKRNRKESFRTASKRSSAVSPGTRLRLLPCSRLNGDLGPGSEPVSPPRKSAVELNREKAEAVLKTEDFLQEKTMCLVSDLPLM